MASEAKISLLRRLLKEPLLHFLALALLIFPAYHLLNRGEMEKPQSIVVTAAKIEQLAAIFTKTWQRPPTAEEFKGLIDDYVKEEIYVREAIALGLDSDDTVIRRRLRLEDGVSDRHGSRCAAAERHGAGSLSAGPCRRVPD